MASQDFVYFGCGTLKLCEAFEAWIAEHEIAGQTASRYKADAALLRGGGSVLGA